MSLVRVMIGAGLVLGLAAGCETAEQRDLEFKLTKIERERNDLAQRLHAEQAKTLVLEQRVESERIRTGTDRAEVSALQSRVRELERTNHDLQTQIEERLNRPLERPSVAASPLPADIDQALTTWANRFSGRVWYDRGRGAVSLANDNLFELGGDAIRPDAISPLQDLAGILATMSQDYDIVVIGHTDDTPITKPETLARHPSNWHLSVHRAIAVKDALTKAGLPATRMGVMGFGSHKPIGADRAQNRRVEIFIVTTGTVQSFTPVKPGT